MDREAALGLVTGDPRSTAIITDFDGTLSPIVDKPGLAQAAEGATAALVSLARMFKTVVVLSGRSLEDLQSRFAPKGVLLLGGYGRERSDRRDLRRRPEGWEAVGVAAVTMTRSLHGVHVERKAGGVALHYRLAPEHAGTIHEIAATLAAEFGLEIRPGRMVAELTAPGPGKADAVADVVGDVSTVLYGGDDVADIEAFAAVKQTANGICVAVASPEAPPQLTSEADLVVDGPHAWVELLREIARRAAG